MTVDAQEPEQTWDEFAESLFVSGLWIQTGVQGVYGRDERFEDVVIAVENLVSKRSRGDGARRVYFPPVLSRETLAHSGYMHSFPSLCGSIHSFSGSDSDHQDFLDVIEKGEDWTNRLEQTELVMTPAACYPLYPTLAGELEEGGRLYDVCSYVFRSEETASPSRLLSFRQKENVRVGSPEDVESWRSRWIDRAAKILGSLELPVRIEVANDPFFGRGGKLLTQQQTEARQKFEITTSLFRDRAPMAIASFNYHADKFGKAFGIHTAKGDIAHTACFGFGLERIALTLFRRHGLNPERWPHSVKNELGIE